MPPVIMQRPNGVKLKAAKHHGPAPAPPPGSSAESERYRLDSERFRGLRAEIAKEDQSLLQAVPLWEMWLERVVNVAILLNSAAIGLESDYPHPELLWVVADNCFTGLFFFELCVRLWKHRHGLLEFFEETWNSLDFAVVFMSVVDVWIMPIAFPSATSGLQVFTIVRLCKLFRMLRILRVRRELVVLVEGLAASMRALVWIGILLFLIIYGSAVMCKTIVAKDYEPEELDMDTYFSDVVGTMLTLFNMCILTEWQEIIRPIYIRQPLMVVVFFMPFLLLCTFGVLNLIIGVIAERTVQTGHEFMEAIVELDKRKKMKVIMKISDEFYDGKPAGFGLSKEVWREMAAAHKELVDTLRSCDLPRGFTMDDLHDILDECNEGLVQKDEFINGLIRLVFNNELQWTCTLLNTIAQVKRQTFKSVELLELQIQRQDSQAPCLELTGDGARTALESQTAETQERQHTLQDENGDLAAAIAELRAELRDCFVCLRKEIHEGFGSAREPVQYSEFSLRCDNDPVMESSGSHLFPQHGGIQRIAPPQVEPSAADRKAGHIEYGDFCKRVEDHLRASGDPKLARTVQNLCTPDMFEEIMSNWDSSLPANSSAGALKVFQEALNRKRRRKKPLAGI